MPWGSRQQPIQRLKGATTNALPGLKPDLLPTKAQACLRLCTHEHLQPSQPALQISAPQGNRPTHLHQPGETACAGCTRRSAVCVTPAAHSSPHSHVRLTRPAWHPPAMRPVASSQARGTGHGARGRNVCGMQSCTRQFLKITACTPGSQACVRNLGAKRRSSSCAGAPHNIWCMCCAIGAIWGWVRPGMDAHRREVGDGMCAGKKER